MRSRGARLRHLQRRRPIRINDRHKPVYIQSMRHSSAAVRRRGRLLPVRLEDDGHSGDDFLRVRNVQELVRAVGVLQSAM